ncbi:hypothetical protein V1478_012561, partial [Vespula squamosa]
IIDETTCAAGYIESVDQSTRQRRSIESRSLRRFAAAGCRHVKGYMLMVGMGLRGFVILISCKSGAYRPYFS